MAITKIDRTVLRTLEPAILAKLNETLGKDFGLNFAFKGGNFTDTSAVLKLEVACVSADGVVNDRARADYEKLAELYDCNPEWLDKTFKVGRSTYQVKGLLTKRRKNCVSIVDVATGTKKICSPQYVAMFLGQYKREVKPTVVDFVAPATPAERVEVEKRIAQMKADGPENYYGDGEFAAAGMSEKAIHDMHFQSILRDLRNPMAKMNLFQTKK
jgi:hypothetical protein